MFTRLLLLAGLFVAGLADTGYLCPPKVFSDKNAKVFGKTCYHFVVNQRKHYAEAQDYCKTNGGNLATIKNQGVNNFIGETLEKYKNIDTRYAWIGLQYIPQEQGYKWDDGSSLGSFQPFTGRKPLKGENCVAMIIKSKVWSDYKCESSAILGLFEWDSATSKKIFVCEYPAKKISLDNCPGSIPMDRYLQVYGKMCYKFAVNDSKTFGEADLECQNHGGRLATTNSPKLDMYVKNQLFDTYGLHDNKTWIGLRYHPGYSQHMWLDGNEVSYFNFRLNIFRTYCIAISSLDGKWLSESCRDEKLSYVCEFKPKPYSPPETTTIPPSPTTTTSEITSQKMSTSGITCPSITCDLNCGLYPYKVNTQTGCLLCECDL